jgi:hypothetical protein
VACRRRIHPRQISRSAFADASRIGHHACVISDVAFEAKRKGVREALPAECWQA